MDSPAPVDSLSVQPSAPNSVAEALQGARNPTRFLRSFGFHILAVLLGIALIFM